MAGTSTWIAMTMTGTTSIISSGHRVNLRYQPKTESFAQTLKDPFVQQNSFEPHLWLSLMEGSSSASLASPSYNRSKCSARVLWSRSRAQVGAYGREHRFSSQAKGRDGREELC